MAAPPTGVNNDKSPPLDMAQENEVNSFLVNHAAMVYLPEQPTEKEVVNIMSVTKHGVLATGSAASRIIGPLMGLFNLIHSDDGYLFCIALPGVNNNDQLKCELQLDGTIKIQGVTVTYTGENKIHFLNMVFEMHTQIFVHLATF